MDDVRSPSEFLYGLEHTASKEDGPFAVVCKEFPVLVLVNAFSVEVVLVVYEIDLHSCGRNGSNLDHKRPVNVVDDDVHAGEADYFVELVLPFVDTAVARHEGPYFLLPFLDALRKIPSDVCDFGFRKIWEYLRIYEQNSFDRFTHNG